jgi:hypothetical protein
MNRQQREEELRLLLSTQRGKEELLGILKNLAGLEGGNLPPFGSLLVETILNYEYPSKSDSQTEAKTEASSTTPATAKSEPGDVKFEAPPGQEAPGG